MSWGSRAVLMAAVLATSGCYVYQPVRPSDAVLQTKVRATVSPRQAAELAPVLRNVTPQVSGTLVQRDDAALMLDVPLFASSQGLSRTPVHNRVRIGVDDLVALETRKLSVWRTGVSLGILATAVGSTWVLLSGEKASREKPGGTDNALRIRIPIRFGFP